MDGISPLDWLLLGILGLSVLIGVWRGLVFEVLSLIGWVAAYFAAQWFAPLMAPHLPVGAAGSGINHAAAFAVTFILSLIAWGLAARLVRLLVSASPLSVIDRVLGAGFGLMRGLVLLLVIATLVAMTPVSRSPSWSGSYGAAVLNVMLQGIKPVLPVEIAQHLPA